MFINKAYIFSLLFLISFSRISMAEDAIYTGDWKLIFGVGTDALRIHSIPFLKKAKTLYKLSKGSVDSVVLSPDNTKVAFTVYPRVMASENLLYLFNINEHNPVLLGEFDLNVLCFSKDGKDLILSKYLRSSSSISEVEIYRFNLDSKVKTFMGRLKNVSELTSQFMSKSESQFVYVDLEDNVMIYDSEDKTLRNLNINGYSPAWSPGGQYIAYQSNNGNCYILDLIDNENQMLWDTKNYKGKIDLVWSPNGKYVLASRAEGGAIRWLSVNDNNKETVYYLIDIDLKHIKTIGTLK